MTEAQGHAGDELQLLLDGRLASERRVAVETHLTTCERCRRELDALRRVKVALRQDLPARPVPPELEARVAAALDAEAARARLRRRSVVAGVVLAAAAALALLLLRPGQPDFVTAAARDFARYPTIALHLHFQTTEPAALERHFASAQIPFPTRVFDFGMMGYRLEGGGVHRLAGRLSALFAYENPAGERVLCQMYLGEVAELPAPTEEREHDDIRFLIYRTEGLTLVFWQEGSVVCVLVADGDPEAAIQLAYAKAVKV
jgi:anti-sigma factor RsiW